MRFEQPQIFWLLLVIPPVLALFFWWGERVRRKLLTQFVESRLLASLTVGLSLTRRKIRYALVLLAVACWLSRLRDRRADSICRKSRNAASTSSWPWTLRNPCWPPTSRPTDCRAPSSPRWS